MAGWVVRQFKGVAPRAEPRLLQDNQAQVAVNCKLWHGSLRPLSENLVVSGDPLTKTGTIKTIYRFGHDTASDSAYWFHWPEDVDVCRGQIFDDTAERTFYTDGTLPKMTDNAIALTGGTDYPENSYTLGVPAPTACTPTLSGSGTGIQETRYYTYTFVTSRGEEGKPAPASVEVAPFPGQTVTLSELDVAPTGGYDIATKRIYRTSTVGASAIWQFVAEIPVAQVTYIDTVATVDLGEEIPSTAYSMPPADMRGLVNMPNGMMAGFTGKEICFCEPYRPHAWPLSYRQTVDYPIMALGSTDTTLVVLTKGYPYIVQGSSPDSMAMVKIDVQQACVSKRSVATLMGSVVYASPDGLWSIGAGSPANLTEVLFTNKEWGAWFKPSSIHAYVHDNKYIGFYDNGTEQGGFILDPVRGDFTLLSFYATAGYYDPQRDSLFLVVGGDLVKFDAGTASLSATWRSKVFYAPRPVNLGAMRVEAAAYPVSVQVFADGVSVGSFTATLSSPFRLPGGFRAKTWEFICTSSSEVFSVGFAETVGDLRNG